MENNTSLITKEETKLLKGIAIFFVVLSHIGNWLDLRYFAPLGGTGVALFLILSGYGLECSYQKNRLQKFWRKR